MQRWSLERKIQVTQLRIIEWYNAWDGNVFISFSGGKDSTVLLDLARRVYPDIEAVFVDTGLEYPEIRDFVKQKELVTWLKPKIPFNKVIEKYGYPVISKEVARDVGVCQRNKDCKTREKFEPESEYTKKYGIQWCQSRWKFLIDAPFKISNQCCDVMKKNPVKHYEKQTGKKQILGTMASESRLRKTTWLKNGCNAFDAIQPKSMPMSFWTEQDVLRYLKQFKITYCSVYGDIVENNKGVLSVTGEQRTGCMFCMFGSHLEKEPNKFQRMKITHPKLWDYCIHKLGCGKVLDYIRVPYE